MCSLWGCVSAHVLHQYAYLTIQETHARTRARSRTNTTHAPQDIPVGNDCENDGDCEHPLNLDSIEARISSRFVSQDEMSLKEL